MLDLYARLGVSSTALPEEIRRAWRERAFQLHPDRNPGDDGAAFRSVSEAYEILSDPERRADYDRTASPLQERRPEGASSPSGWRDAPPMWRDPFSMRREAQIWRESRAWQEARLQQEAQREAHLRAQRRRAYEAEQARLEAELGVHLGDWTRCGVMRDGSVGRRR